MYFRDAETPSKRQRLYFTLRGCLLIVSGAILLAAPLWMVKEIVQFLGVVILIDGLAILIHLSAEAKHLRKISIAKAVIELCVGGLLLVRDSVGLDLMLAVVGLLLIFRGILELISFAEAYVRVDHQRLMFASALLSLLLGLLVLLGIPQDLRYLVAIIGIYLLFEGVLQLAGIARYRRSSTTAAATKRDPSITFLHIDPRKYKKLLVMTPHPDDLEGFTGGLVYRATQAQVEVVSVIFAGGDRGVWDQRYEQVPEEEYIHLRLEESEQAAKLLGVEKITYMGYLDRAVVCDEAAIARALAQIEQHQPDVIVSFEFYHDLTPYPHPDHLATGQIVRHAITRYQNRQALDYFVTSTLLPNRFINVSKVRAIKLKALACHTTQAGLNAIIFPLLEKFFCRLWGMFVGAEYSEGYRQIDIPSLVQKVAKEQQ